MKSLNCGKYSLNLSSVKVMGVLNVTPDSFSDGGRFVDTEKALAHAIAMAEAGAAIIDIGGESTRPGANDISEQQEIDRVVPIIQALRSEITIPISIDTSKAAVMKAAVQAGAGLINDVRALQDTDALLTAQQCDVSVCLMHMQGQPRTMQQQPHYHDVVAEIIQFFRQRIDACLAAGINQDKIIIDPGFGFGKTTQHNLLLMKHLQQFKQLGVPILLGVSRKASIGELLNAPVNKRLAGSLAMATVAAMNGANIIRAHDVKETVDAMTMVNALLNVKELGT